MANNLDVVNECLAIMGEAPLNAIAEDHAFKQGALNLLERLDRQIQSKGWWFNKERLILKVNIADHRIYVPTDCLKVDMLDERPNLVQRGRIIYDVYRGTDRFEDNEEFRVVITRRLPLEDVPDSVNALIARSTVLAFQSSYDGDSTKTRDLKQEVYGSPTTGQSHETPGLWGLANAEHIRNQRVNFIEQSERLGRITNVVNYSRRPR